jgi:hypothetical protein
MYVPKKGGVKLSDCQAWIEYLYKVRSKAGVVGTIYSASRNKATKEDAQLAAPAKELAQQATSTTNNETNDNGEEMISNELTPAGYTYLAGVYEQAVDKRLNMLEIQAFLRGRGINKSLAMIRQDLNETFCFYKYADQHPAPAIESYAVIDAQLFKIRPARKPGSLGC